MAGTTCAFGRGQVGLPAVGGKIVGVLLVAEEPMLGSVELDVLAGTLVDGLRRSRVAFADRAVLVYAERGQWRFTPFSGEAPCQVAQSKPNRTPPTLAARRSAIYSHQPNPDSVDQELRESLNTSMTVLPERLVHDLTWPDDGGQSQQ